MIKSIKAQWQESIIPKNVEEITSEVRYHKGLVDIYISYVTDRKEIREKLPGLKEIDNLKVIKIIGTSHTLPIKPRDKFYIFNDIYQVQQVDSYLDAKWNAIIVNNPNLVDRYAEKIVVLS